MKKILFVSILFLGLGLTTGNAQSKKLEEKATELVEKLNNEIVSINRGQKLTEEQEKQIYAIHLERLKEIRKANKNGADKAEKKQINKKYYQQIFRDVLNKHQRRARKIGKSKKDN